MREIKFRGKRKDGNGWVYGDLNQHDIHHGTSILVNGVINNAVIPETIGQFTGLYAKHHKSNLESEIYEDDIFRCTNETFYGDEIGYLVVMWIKQLAAYYLVPIERYYVLRDNDVSNEPAFSWLFEEAELRDFSIDIGLMKVGSIQDNPELINNKASEVCL